MAQQLVDMDIDSISLVDKGANKRRFAILKRDGAVDPEKRGLLATLAKALGFELADVAKAKTKREADMPEAIAKAQTFATIVAGQQLSAALDDNFWTLKDALWSAIYARDEEDQLLSPEARDALVAQSLDEFKAYLIDAMHAGVAKAEEPVPDALAGGIDAAVRKVGKKISAARLERLKAAADSLSSVLAQVDASDEDVTKRAQPEEVPMTGDELAQVQKAITDAIAPIAADVAVLKAAAAKPTDQPKPDPVTKGDEDDDMVPEGTAKVLKVVLERLDKLETARSVRTSIAGQDETVTKKASQWAGVL